MNRDTMALAGVLCTIAGAVLIDRAYKGRRRPPAVRALQLVGGVSDVWDGVR